MIMLKVMLKCLNDVCLRNSICFMLKLLKMIFKGKNVASFMN